MTSILLLDDDSIIHKVVELALGRKYRIFSALTFDQAVALLEQEEIDGAIVDINLKDSEHNGLDFLAVFKKKYPEKPALVESGYRDVATVVKSMKAGADDYLEKPFDEGTLNLKIEKVFSDTRRIRVFKRAFEKSSAINQIVGSSPKIRHAMDLVERAQDMRLLLYGETGVGKTPFAWWSNRVVSRQQGQERPFEQVNCACLTAEQFQDQLFGHRKGAFTSAISDKRGLVELAKGGDLFLDEIGELSLEAQAHFLTFLDTMDYYRLGDDKKRKADVRVICATNRDLKEMIQQGKFRKDLYSRISQVVVPIPPLREHLEDISELFEYFVEQFAGQQKSYEPAIIDLLKRYSWEEGNVRELRDVVEYACMMSRNSEQIKVQHLSEGYRPLGEESVPLDTTAAPIPEGFPGIFDYGLETYMSHLEKKILENKVKEFSGSLGSLARKLKISRPTLYRRLKKYDISGGKMDELE